MEHWPSGSHLVMKTITPDHHVTLYVIGYKYNKKNVTVFIFTENAGTTECGEPYTAKWNDDFGARQTRKIDRPDVISQYFKIANVIDIHNQSRQGVLVLEGNLGTIVFTIYKKTPHRYGVLLAIIVIAQQK